MMLYHSIINSVETHSKKYSKRATQIKSSAKLLQQVNSVSKETVVDIKAAEIDQAKDQGKYTKKTMR